MDIISSHGKFTSGRSGAFALCRAAAPSVSRHQRADGTVISKCDERQPHQQATTSITQGTDPRRPRTFTSADCR